MAEFKYIDLNYLQDLALGSKDFMIDMISSFLKTTPDALEKLKKANEEGDWKKVGSVAHKLKTSFSFMGMEDTVETAKALQDFGLNEHSVDQIDGLIEKMIVDYNNAEGELQSELSNMNA